MTDLLQVVIDADKSVTAVPVHGGWVEVDTVKDLDADITFDRISAIESIFRTI